MKVLFNLFCFSLLIVSGCKKNPQDSNYYMNEAVITGFDNRMCACCGGLMFHFTATVDSISDHDRLVDDKNLLGITNDTKFPLTVKLDWTKSKSCLGNFIYVTKVSMR